MNKSLEFHDSVVTGSAMRGAALVMSFRAYVHASLGEPGIDEGDGYGQAIELVIEGASVVGEVKAGALSDGSVHVNSVEHFLVPLPCSVSGDVFVDLTFVSGRRAAVVGTSMTCNATGPEEWIERYEGSRSNPTFQRTASPPLN